MGQKVHPNGIRLGITKDHTSIWYAERGDYADKLFDDIKVREFLDAKLKNAQIVVGLTKKLDQLMTLKV